MLEWKPPDPRIVALVRRIQSAADRRLRHATRSRASLATTDAQPAIDQEVDDRARELMEPGADAPDHDPDD